jgi:hypothetical protein
MAGGYVPKWMPLLEAIEYFQRVAGTLQNAADELVALLREGVVRSRYRGQDDEITAEQWYRATVYGDGTVTFAADPRFPLLGRSFGLGQPRYSIEVWRSHVLKHRQQSERTIEGKTTARRPYRRERVESAMRAQLASGAITRERLRAMLEKELKCQYGASRDTCRKARNSVLASAESIDSIPTNDK